MKKILEMKNNSEHKDIKADYNLTKYLIMLSEMEYKEINKITLEKCLKNKEDYEKLINLIEDLEEIENGITTIEKNKLKDILEIISDGRYIFKDKILCVRANNIIDDLRKYKNNKDNREENYINIIKIKRNVLERLFNKTKILEIDKETIKALEEMINEYSYIFNHEEVCETFNEICKEYIEFNRIKIIFKRGTERKIYKSLKRLNLKVKNLNICNRTVNFVLSQK